MQDAKDYQFWRAALRGEKQLVQETNPQCGFYKRRLAKDGPWLPIAFWRDKDDRVVCCFEGKPVDPLVHWTFVAKFPVSETSYRHYIRNGSWPEDGPQAPPRSNMPSDPFEALRLEVEDKLEQAQTWLKIAPKAPTETDANIARNIRTCFGENGFRSQYHVCRNSRNVKATKKYTQIVASIREVGIIEPPVISRLSSVSGKYLLLDGHLRVEALKDMGENEVQCLLSTDDEGVTYNKHVSHLSIVQEHKMIMKNIERGVSEARIAKALAVDVSYLRAKLRLFKGICPEVIDMLKDKDIHTNALMILKRMVPLRQIEAVELMVAMNKFTAGYAQSLLAATPQAQLVDASRAKRIKGLTEKQMQLMQRESANLDRQFKLIEQTYGKDHLDLVLIKGYLARMLGNAAVSKFLSEHYAEILAEFQKLTGRTAAA